MELFTNCSGSCCVCRVGLGCLAGHGDDFFKPASKEDIIDRLNNHQYDSYRQYMIGYLKEHYDHEYNEKRDRRE